MPERSFGRTVRYRRTKLGLSQAKLAELVGRSTPTIRSWERDKSRPNDPKVLAALAAVLGIDEAHLFDKAEVERPEEETSPTVEEALATLSLDESGSVDTADGDEDPFAPASGDEVAEPEPVEAAPVEAEPELKPFRVAGQEQAPDPTPDRGQPEPREPTPEHDRELVAAGTGPAYAAPPEPYQRTPLTPTLADASYIEDNSQRQVYRVRTLATLVAFVVLVIALIWAVGEGLGALGAWWDGFVGQLRL